VPSVTETGPGLVTLHLWRVPAGRIASAPGRVAVDRFALRRQPGAGFSRLLGTANGHTFRPRDAEPRRWEPYARFAVLDAAGTVDGRDPLRGPAW
jgi:hypothetical protein